ncbi:MAG: LysR family transcriptional regulator [Kofleriaceae bacterium]|nr:LysR family transcriptional regulator [Kofleriaceae bacterium]
MDTLVLRTFTAAAEAGTLSAAARRLGAQLSTVSRQIRDLEAALGVAMFARTGRGVRLTKAGERFLERTRYVLRELDDACAEARGERRAEITQLRISAPLELAMRLLPDVLTQVRAAHPGVFLDVQTDTRRVSLLEEDFDAALRLGSVKESELVARPLGAVSLGLYARRPRAELGAVVAVAGARGELAVTSRGRKRTLRLDAAVRVSTFTEAAELVVRSDLATMLPSFTARPYLARRQLVRILPGLSLAPAPLHLVLPQRLRGASVLATLALATSTALAAAEAQLR